MKEECGIVGIDCEYCDMKPTCTDFNDTENSVKAYYKEQIRLRKAGKSQSIDTMVDEIVKALCNDIEKHQIYTSYDECFEFRCFVTNLYNNITEMRTQATIMIFDRVIEELKKKYGFEKIKLNPVSDSEVPCKLGEVLISCVIYP